MKKIISVLACAAVLIQPSLVEARPATATYYSDRFHGSRMANGGRFSQNGMTAAHPSLPIGTKLRVTNPRNGKSVVVTVTDRCGACSLDLSKSAFGKLGNFHHGRIPVTIRRLR